MEYSDENQKIKTLSDYKNLFDNGFDLCAFLKPTKKEKALEMALETRKFEIELYWKRATYFWAFIALMFTSYFVVFKADGWEIVAYKHELLLGVSSMGMFLSVCWFCVNKGAKYWQENWEQHVDLLEDGIMGPLYKTTKDCGGFSNAISPWSSFKYSVGKINIFISAVMTIVWLFLLIFSFLICFDFDEPFGKYFFEVVILILAFTSTLGIFFFCRSTESNGNKNVAFSKRSIKQ